MTDLAITDDSISLADAEREPYIESIPDGRLVRRSRARARYYPPWPGPPEEYAWTHAEREQERVASIDSRPPKTRNGGFHGDVLPGEVGPCTRCGWVWYPISKTLLRSDFPHRCSNCRTPDWRIPPKYSERDEKFHYDHFHRTPYAACKICHPARPGDPKWLSKRGAIIERRKMRHARRLAELAEEFGKVLVDSNVTTPNVTLPLPRTGHVIPPPPSFEEEQK